jgi:hypothetical protein
LHRVINLPAEKSSRQNAFFRPRGMLLVLPHEYLALD